MGVFAVFQVACTRVMRLMTEIGSDATRQSVESKKLDCVNVKSGYFKVNKQILMN